MLEKNHCCLSGSDHDDNYAASADGTGCNRNYGSSQKNNKVLTYKAGEKKTWTFTVTNHSGNPMNNVTITQIWETTMKIGHLKPKNRVTSRTLEPWKTENQKMWRLILLQREDVQLHAIL